MEQVTISAYQNEDLEEITRIWNDVVREGKAFPQMQELSLREAETFFAQQSFCGVARRQGRAVGLYILHPNNIGRCGHLANASYAVARDLRGRHIGEQLVAHSLKQAKELGFGVMQFNAVVAGNLPAIHLYEKLGFVRLGKIPRGFLSANGDYEDILLFYHTL